MFVPFGFDLRLSSISAPILTVGEVSYGAATPAPPAKWVLVTFSDTQPCLLFVFPAETASTVVTGRSGEWRLKTTTPMSGWVRVCLPFGTKGVSASGVGALGALSKDVAHREFLWTQEAPVLKSVEALADEESVTLKWVFDKGGALVPPAFELAKRAGSKATTDSPIASLGIATEEGPVSFVRGPELAIRFPLAPLWKGRSVSLGKPDSGRPPSSTQPNLAVTVETALLNLTGWRDTDWLRWSRASLDEYFSRVIFTTEPRTGIKLPFEADGTGIDVTAANALLMQTVGDVETGNSLLASVLWRMDPMTWKICCSQGDLGRRSAALSSITASLDAKDEVRALGAMLHDGLLAESNLPRFCEEVGLAAPSVSKVDPLIGFRREIFGQQERSAFTASLCSPVRLQSGQAVLASVKESLVNVQWTQGQGEGTLDLRLLKPFELSAPVNLKPFTTGAPPVGLRKLEPLLLGYCSFSLKSPKAQVKLPASVLPPKYSE